MISIFPSVSTKYVGSDVPRLDSFSGQTATQGIALSVKGGKCRMRHQRHGCWVAVVGSYDKSAVVTAGKLESTDGIYGLRFAHNTEVAVPGFGMTKWLFEIIEN